MSLTPGYGETPVPDDDLDSLRAGVRELLGDPLSKAAIYDLEQGIQANVAEALLTDGPTDLGDQRAALRLAAGDGHGLRFRERSGCGLSLWNLG
jgi:hypothetical protein